MCGSCNCVPSICLDFEIGKKQLRSHRKINQFLLKEFYFKIHVKKNSVCETPKQAKIKLHTTKS